MFRTLPNGKRISRIGFGCSAIFAKRRFSPHTAETILETACSNGINHFDSSPSYGWGEAERRLGRFIAGTPGSDFVVSTKVGTFKGRHGRYVKDFSPATLEQSLTESLARLRLERVDILYLHGPTARSFNEDVFRFFEREKVRGRIIYSGVNSFDRQIISQFAVSPLDVIMLQYSVADCSTTDLFDGLVSNGKLIVAGTVLAQGVTRPSTFVPLSWKHCWYLARAVKNDPFFALRGYRISRELASRGLTAPTDLLRFVLADERIISGIFSSSNPAHVAANAKAVSSPLEPSVRVALFNQLRRMQQAV